MGEIGERIEDLEKKIDQVSLRVPAMFAGSVKPVSELISSMVEIMADMSAEIDRLRDDLNASNW